MFNDNDDDVDDELSSLLLLLLLLVASWDMVAARASISAHLLALLRPGEESHLLRRAVTRDLIILFCAWA